MSSPIFVTGGTGTLGRQLVPMLRAGGRKVRVLSRGNPSTEADELAAGDLESGTGLDAALSGVDVVVHCAGSAKGDAQKARHLVEAAKRSGTVRHIVYISVVGADSVPIESGIDRTMFGYYGEKGEAERIIAESGIPWTTLRATQFHDLVLTTIEQMAKLPAVPVPAGISFQPVDSGEVAGRLAELALGEPQGLVPEFGGPRIYGMADLVRSYLAVAGKRRPIIQLPLPGAAARSLREGANLAPDRAIGQRTWEDFLAERVRLPAAA